MMERTHRHSPTLAPPVVRCGVCGGWLTRRAVQVEELPAQAFTCGLCGEDYEIRGGRLVTIRHLATAATLAEIRHAAHVTTILDNKARRTGRPT